MEYLKRSFDQIHQLREGVKFIDKYMFERIIPYILSKLNKS
jgi:hypothetical protein